MESSADQSTAGAAAPPPSTDRDERTAAVTLQDVAVAAGVHYSTVSRALDPAKAWRVSERTRAHVETVAREMGYRRHMGASGLKRGRTHTVAVVVADLGNPFIAPALRGIANRLEEASLMPLITETQDDPARLARVLNHAVERRADAIIVAAAHLANARILLDVAQRRIPLLLADRNVPQTRLPSCTHDNVAGGRLAAEHLAELGHRRVAQLWGPRDVSSFVDRGQAFSSAASAAGIVEVELDDAAPVPTEAEGRRLVQRLVGLDAERPTALFAHNDLMALGALEALEAAGLRCPEDISVIGYDDLPHVDRVIPALTTVRLHSEELGRLVGEMTVSTIATPHGPPMTLTVPPKLIVRASTRRVDRTKKPRSR